MIDVNLKAMLSIQTAFGVQLGILIILLESKYQFAVALGAKVIEKHFTLDRTMKGPDHKASLEPDELKTMIQYIRNTELAISGDGIKRPSPSETKNIHIARKSLVALAPIQLGEYFSEANMGVKRPGIGISPMRWDEFIGRPANRDYQVDELIDG